MMNLFSIGFTQKSAEKFFGLLKDNKIDCLVDIRLNPNGQLSRFAFEKDLPYFLDKLVDGCKYVHRVDLAPPNKLLKEVRSKGSEMSKNYKLFEKEFNKYLEEESKIKDFVEQFKNYQNVALLCSEHTTEKCHRRLVCDMLLNIFSNDIAFGGHLK
ncbi:MAG: DUF488 domain-containing protein [Ignavibacteriales bacterium]|nr:DUF488 domain-containing protein [Ignavibacteriales bacterium]